MKPVTFLVALAGLAACDAQVETRKTAVPAAEQSAPTAAAAPLTAAGPAAIVQPDADEGQQWAAAVVELTPLTRQGDRTVKLFGTAGGDPAMNGLYTHIAFFDAPAEGWRVFRIGDFLDYRLLSEARAGSIWRSTKAPWTRRPATSAAAHGVSSSAGQSPRTVPRLPR